MAKASTQLLVSLEEIIRAPFPCLKRRQRWTLRILLIILRPLIRLEHEERLICNSNKPVVYVFNHNTGYETLLTALYLICRQGKIISFIIDWMYQYIPGLGWLFKQIKPVYTYHKPTTIPLLNLLRKQTAPQAVYEKCILKIREGESIGIYPEGTRNKHPFRLKKGHSGVGRIILETGVIVQPVGIDFPGRIQQSRIPAFGPLILRIGEPLNFTKECNRYKELKENRAADPVSERQKHYLIKNIIYKVMQALACVSGKMYPYMAPRY